MPKLLDIDPHRGIAQFNWEAIQHLLAGQQIAAIGDVVLPAVPGAGDAVAVELPLGDGAALVGAHSINSKYPLRTTEQRYDARLDDEFTTAASRDVGRLTYVMPSQINELLLRLSIG